MSNKPARPARPARLLIAASLAAALLTSTACSSGGDSAGGGGDVKLRMTVWTPDKAQLALFKSIADEYKKSHANIASISFDVVPFESYTTALTTQLAGSNPPDLVWVLERDAPDFVNSGALADVKPTLEKTEGYNLDELTPTATKLWQKDGGLYAYPFSTSPFGMFYNKDLLAKAKVTETPDDLVKNDTWTWENAEKIAAQVADRSDGKSGLVIRDFDYKMWLLLAQVWRGWGAQAWSEDGKTCGFDSPEMTEAMTFLHNAIFKDKALPGPGTTADFFAGESGMTITQISRAGLLAEKPFKWGIVPLPSGPKGEAQVIGQAGIGVTSKGKNKDAAADFLAFFTSPENSAKLAQYFPPARDSQINAESLAKASPLFTPEQLQSVVVNGIKTGEVLPAHTNGAKIDKVVQSALDPLWKADADVAKVLAEVCKVLEPELQR